MSARLFVVQGVTSPALVRENRASFCVKSLQRLLFSSSIPGNRRQTKDTPSSPILCHHPGARVCQKPSENAENEPTTIIFPSKGVVLQNSACMKALDPSPCLGCLPVLAIRLIDSQHVLFQSNAIFTLTARSAHSLGSDKESRESRRTLFSCFPLCSNKGPCTQQMHEYVDGRCSSIEATHRDVFAGMLSLFNSLDATLHLITFEALGRATGEMMRCTIDFAVSSLFADGWSAPGTRSRQAAPALPTA